MSASILTVDDSVSIRQAIRLTLSGAGFKVEEAGDGAEGLAKAAAGDFKLILTDLNMPVMNGLQMIQELRNRRILMGVPIVFLTTESDAGIKEQAKAAGATGWLTKPFVPEMLLRIVNKVLGQ
jgi:two-component system chemotaxis response regulator CheY